MAPAAPPPGPQPVAEPQERHWRVQVDQANEGTVVAAGIAAIRLEDRREFDRLIRVVRADSFQIREHQQIWTALVELRRKGLSFDAEALRRILPDEQILDYAIQLRDGRPEFPPNIDFFVANLDWDRARAEATRGPLTALLDALRDVRTPSERTQALARQVVEVLDSVGGIRALRSPEVIKREAMAAIDARIHGQAIWPFGIPGFDVDAEGEPALREDGMPRIAPGAMPGGVTVITAVPRMGKSTFVRTMVSGLINSGRRVLYGAWEESDSHKVAPMLAAHRCGISRGRLMVGAINPEERARLDTELDKVLSVVRFVENPLRTGKARTADEVVDAIHGLIADSACDVFVADLLRRAFRFESVGEEEEALFKLQAIAEENQIHMVWAQQQRHKETEARRDPRPTLEGIKGPGAWGEVPDNVFGIFRPAFYRNVPDEQLQVHALKQRDGAAPLLVGFEFNPSEGVLRNGAEQEYDRRRFSEEENATDNALQAGGGRRRRRVGPAGA